MPVMLVPVVVAVNEAVVVAEDVTVAEDAELDVKVGAEVDEKEGLLRSVVAASARARWRATTTWYLCKPQKGERRTGRRRVRRHSMRHPEA
ncbi:hypothetical protein KRP22_002433 [Phytophthora ramorum]|nr:hypothetical protein KRP22_6081 [Phytophthora ramorum]